MSRHGMSECDGFDSREDYWAYIRYRGAVNSAIRGKRGQAFLRELVASLDALPEKKLIEGELQNANGEVCAIGSVGRARGIDMSSLDVYDSQAIAEVFGISEKLVREIEFINDDCVYARKDEKDVKRWEKVRDWAESELIDDKPEGGAHERS